jgi:hypothetical protein
MGEQEKEGWVTGDNNIFDAAKGPETQSFRGTGHEMSSTQRAYVCEVVQWPFRGDGLANSPTVSRDGPGVQRATEMRGASNGLLRTLTAPRGGSSGLW